MEGAWIKVMWYVFKNVESLPAYATNLSAKRLLRYGGTQEIQNHINAGSLAAVLRGGWALDEKET